LTNNRIQAIPKYLEELNGLKCSLPLVLDLQDICKLYLNIFEDEDISEKNINHFEKKINDRMHGVFEFSEKHAFKTFNDSYADVY